MYLISLTSQSCELRITNNVCSWINGRWSARSRRLDIDSDGVRLRSGKVRKGLITSDGEGVIAGAIDGDG